VILSAKTPHGADEVVESMAADDRLWHIATNLTAA
jgi:hypothetical protein